MLIKIIVVLFALGAIPLLATESDLQKAVAFRKTEQFGKAERLLKKYSSPANFDSLKSAEKIEFLRGLLELAHIRALKDDVTGSLALLNWAEGRSDPYQRAIACVKYAEILLDLGEFERASAYLKNADEVINSRATEEDTGAAIGQGGVTADTGAVWRDLRDDAALLKAEIESEELKKKFGASYGNYVKLRRLQVLLKRSRTPRYLKEAMKLADELIETDPASQFAAAAGYLKGEIMASRLKEESPKKEIKEVKDYLDKFVRQQPDGLYRGEALMLLGKISLEIEWNAKNAEKYYSQALNWFRKAREKRDAVSLYAAMNDDLKKQSAPTQKPTTLNQWKRIVYHDEDPLKLYNTANAPVWYVDDKEKNCLLLNGFFAYNSEKYIEAKQFWEAISNKDAELASMNAKNLPTYGKRLLIAAKNKKMLFSAEQKKQLSPVERLRLCYGEYLFGLERFSEAAIIFKQKCSSRNKLVAFLGGIGFSYCCQMANWSSINSERINIGKVTWLNLYEKNINTPYAEEALYNLITFYAASTTTHKESLKYCEHYLQKYPRGKYRASILLIAAMSKLSDKDFAGMFKLYQQLNKEHPGSFQAKQFERVFQLENIDPKTGKPKEKKGR